MKTILLRGIVIAATACVPAAVHADHMSVWGPGWANMPNDIHNTRIETRLADDDDAFRDFVIYSDGADITNRYLVEETLAVDAALASGQQVDQLAARLVPEQEFLGGGWARYMQPGDATLVSRVLNINVRLRLVTKNDAVANEALALTAENAGAKAVSAHFGYLTADASVDYAACSLEPGDPIDTDSDGVADYAVYSLSLMEDTTGVIEGTGGCTAVVGDTLNEQTMLPDVQLGDIVDIAVDGIRPVLRGSF
jgi:hypothetical protein